MAADPKKRKKASAQGRKRKRRKKRMRPAELILIVIFAGIFLLSAGQLLMIFLEYHQGSAEYGALAETYVEYGKSGSETEDQPGGFPEISVNFEALEEVNGDFRAWLVIPALSVEYPVVQGGGYVVLSDPYV